MNERDTVPKRLMLDLATSFEREARGVLGPGIEQCSPQGKKYRQMHARCFRACADRLRRTLQDGKVCDGCY